MTDDNISTNSASSQTSGEEEKSENGITNTNLKTNNDIVLDKNAPKPKLCHLKKWEYFEGYGFNLHSKSGQVVGKIDKNSPAESGGLREGDRIIEVNNVNVVNESHKSVVKIIKNGLQRDGISFDDEVLLLLVDPDAFDYYNKIGYSLNSNMPNIVKYSNIKLKEFYEIEINRLKNENQQLAEENKRKQLNLIEINQLVQKNESLIHELNTQNKSLESQIKDLESTIEIEKNNSKKLDEELDKFKSQTQLLELDNEKFRNLNNEKNESKENFKSELELAKSKLAEQDILIGNQNTEIENRNEKIKELSNKVNELELKHENSLKQIENLILEHEKSLKGSNSDFEIKICQLQNELNSEKENYKSLNKNFENLQECIKELKANLQASETKISENNALVDRQKNEIGERDNQIRNLNELKIKNETLLTINLDKINELKDKVKLLEADCRKFQTLYNEKLDYEDSLKSEFDHLKAEYENTIAKQNNYTENLNKKIEELKNALSLKLNDFESENESSSKKIEELSETNKKLVAEKDKLIEDIRKSNVTVEAEKEKNRNLLKNIDDLQSKIALIEVANRQFEDLISEKNNKEKDLINKLELVETKIIEHKGLVEKLNQDIILREQMINDLNEEHKEEVNELKSKIDISSNKIDNMAKNHQVSIENHQAELKNKEEHFQEQINKFNSNYDSLNNKYLDEIKQIEADFALKIKAYDIDINDLKTKNSSLENEIKQQKEIHLQTLTEESYLKKQLAHSKQKIEEAHNVEKSLKEKISNLENEIKSQFNKFKNEFETLNVLKVSELIMLETEFNSKMDFLEAENTKLKDMCDKRIESHKGLLTELIVAETKIAEYKKLIEKLNTDISDRENQINQLIENHDKKVKNKTEQLFTLIEDRNKNLNNQKMKAFQDQLKHSNLIENSLNLIFNNDNFKISKTNNPKLVVNIILNTTIQNNIPNKNNN